jgi:predicted LPLAT superfamily acyltransferase
VLEVVMSSKNDLMILSPGETLEERIADLIAFQDEQSAIIRLAHDRGHRVANARLQLYEIQGALAELQGHRRMNAAA